MRVSKWNNICFNCCTWDVKQVAMWAGIDVTSSTGDPGPGRQFLLDYRVVLQLNGVCGRWAPGAAGNRALHLLQVNIAPRCLATFGRAAGAKNRGIWLLAHHLVVLRYIGVSCRGRVVCWSGAIRHQRRDKAVTRDLGDAWLWNVRVITAQNRTLGRSSDLTSEVTSITLNTDTGKHTDTEPFTTLSDKAPTAGWTWHRNHK